MNIAFDIDGVVLNSIEVILERINEVKGKTLTTADLLTWELERLGLDTATLWEAVDYMYSQPRIDPYEAAIDVLGRIHDETGKPLLFITGRRHPQTALRQLEALDWGRKVPDMIVKGGRRHKLSEILENQVEFIIEDDVEYVEEYLDAGIGVGLMIRPWNKQSKISVTNRFHSWEDIAEWFLASGGNGKSRQS